MIAALKSKLTPIVHNIAQEIDCGNKVFMHRRTFEMESYPDEIHWPGIEDNEWLYEIKEKVEADWDNYICFAPLHSSESFRIMESFAETVKDLHLQNRLFDALSGRKPFRNFKHLVENPGPYRQKWFDFKQTQLEETVWEILYSEDLK